MNHFEAYASLASDVLKITIAAQQKQERFLRHQGLTLDAVRLMSVSDFEKTEAAYAAFA